MSLACRITATGDKTSVLVMRREVYRALQLQTGWDPANPMVWRFPAELLPWLENEIDATSGVPGAAVASNRSLADLADMGVSTESSIVVLGSALGARDEYIAWAEANRTPGGVRHGC